MPVSETVQLEPEVNGEAVTLYPHYEGYGHRIMQELCHQINLFSLLQNFEEMPCIS